jgi:large repetitive protein
MIFDIVRRSLKAGTNEHGFRYIVSTLIFFVSAFPLSGQHGFVFNAGQVFNQNNKPNSHVQFLNRIGDFQVQLNKNGFSYEMFRKREVDDSVDVHRLDFKFVNFLNRDLIINWQGQDKRNDYNNYYNQLGQFDHVPLFQTASALVGNSKILAHNVNIGGNRGMFKYDIITQYEDLSEIKIQVSGADSIKTTGADLYLFVGKDTLIETIPQTTIKIGSTNTNIPLIWKCLNMEKGIYGFSHDEKIEYPKNSTLTIDPIPMLRWATYFGGGSNDAGNGTATTSDGNAIFCGQTASNSQVASSGAHQTTIGGNDDVFLCKFHRRGGASSRIWSTYLGGANSEYATAVAVDSKDFIAITGLTYTSGMSYASKYNGTYNAKSDAFVSRFKDNGTLSWFNYIGGSENDIGRGIAFDKSRNVIVVGETASSGITSKASAFNIHQSSLSAGSDGFLLKIDSLGNLNYLTYYGGSGTDVLKAVTIGNGDTIYAGGYTNSSSGISTTNSYSKQEDGFLFSMTPGGIRIKSLYFGENGDDQIRGLSFVKNRLIATGSTNSEKNIAKNAHQSILNSKVTVTKLDAFLTQLSSTFDIIWSTYYGGELEDVSNSVVCDDSGFVYMCGTANSDDLSITTIISTADAYQTETGGGSDVFVAKFGFNGKRIWGTYFGGKGTDEGNSIGHGKLRDIYFCGHTASSTNIIKNPFQNSIGGSVDAYLGDFQYCKKFAIIRKDTVCLGDTLTLKFTDSAHTKNWGLTFKKFSFSWYGPKGNQISNSQHLKRLVSIADTGFYVLVVRDSFGCVDTAKIRWRDYYERPSVNINGKSSDTTVCKYDNFDLFGSIKSNPNGSVTKKTNGSSMIYQWTGPNGFSSVLQSNTIKSVIKGKHDGKYQLIGTDSNGCKNIDTLRVFIGPNFTLKSNGFVCLKDTIKLDILPLNRGLKSISWTGPDGFSSLNRNPRIYAKTSSGGQYSCIVVDSNGCDDTLKITIPNPNSLTAQFAINDSIQCLSGNSFSFTNNSLPTSGLTFSWKFGDNTESTISSPTKSFSQAGKYSVKLIASSTCRDSITKNIYIYREPQIVDTVKFIKCFGDNTGSINIGVTGGTPNWKGQYSYSWSKTGYSNTSQNIKGLYSGTYKLTVTDSNGCTLTKDIVVSESSKLVLTLSGVNIKCYGDKTGTITSTITGGTGPYTYAWSTGASTSGLSGLAKGNYSLTVTDGNGCKIIKDILLTEPSAALTVTAKQVDVKCNGASTGSIDITPTGGTPDASGNYKYSWTKSPSITQINTTQDLSSISAGTYTVIVTDANGCTTTISVTIKEPTNALSLKDTTVNIKCFGDNTGSINIGVTGGTPNWKGQYSYSWSKTGYSNTSQNIKGLYSGTYKLTVTDSNGCTLTKDIVVSEPTALSLTLTGSNIKCYGDKTGSITSSITGGTAPYTYSWSTGASTSGLSGLAKGNYSLTVTDGNGCKIIKDILLTEPSAALTVTAKQVDVKCNGASTGSIDITPTGGTPDASGNYKYSWTKSPSITQINTTQDLSSISAGTYTVIVTDANGCTTTISVTIKEPTNALSLKDTTVNIKCFGDNTGSINIGVTGGTPNWKGQYSYSWSKTGYSNTSQNIKGLYSGTYKLTVTDSNGCTLTKDIVVSEPTALSLTLTGSNIKCYGDKTGSITSSITGGTAPYTYSWSTGASTSGLSGLAKGNYSLTVTDGNGCKIIKDILLTEPSAALTVTAKQVDVKCNGASTGSIDITPTGGTPDASGNYKYSWTKSPSITQINTTQDLSSISAGTYTVIVTDANGCTTTISVTIKEPTNALSLKDTTVNIKCFGDNTGSINIGVTGGTPNWKGQYSYSWSKTGYSNTSQNIKGLYSGTYKLTVTDSNGCTLTKDIVVSEPTALSLTLTGSNIKCYGDKTGSITSSITGGTAPYTYSWSTGASTSGLSGLAKGNYSLTVTDGNGCKIIKDILLTEPSAALTVTAKQVDVKCNGASTGSIDITPTGGTPDASGNYKYSWTKSPSTTEIGITQDLSGISAGTYTVVVTDANGCNTTTAVTLTEPLAVLTVSAKKIDVKCNGASTGSIDITTSGGTADASGNYKYSWTKSPSTTQISTSQDLSGLAVGTYSVLITDANGCTENTSVIISEPKDVFYITDTYKDVKCNGGKDGYINIVVYGGSLNKAGVYKSFSWTLAPGTSVYSTSQNIKGLSAGNYAVSVLDDSGCIASLVREIKEPKKIVISANVTNVQCNGGATGKIELSTITGGTVKKDYSYKWTHNVSSFSSTKRNIDTLFVGKYTVIVTDDSGCTMENIYTISEPAASLVLSTVVTHNPCYGDTIGKIDLTVSGGTGTKIYKWVGPAGFKDQSTEDIDNLKGGNYTVYVRDPNDCRASLSVKITQPDKPLLITKKDSGNLICNGVPIGFTRVDVTGGTKSYIFKWTGPTGFKDPGTQDLDYLYAGKYDLTVSDANNCKAITNFTITEPTKLTINGVVTDALCNGSCDGKIDITVKDGTPKTGGGYDFSWYKNGSTSAFSNLEDISSQCAGDYKIVITDSNSCTATTTLAIKEPTALQCSTSVIDVKCYGDNTGSIKSYPSGGTKGLNGDYKSYSWTGPSGFTDPGTSDASKLKAGDYTLTIIDANGCKITKKQTIQEPRKAITLQYTVTQIKCNGEKTGEISNTLSGGTVANGKDYSYSWTGPTGFVNPGTCNLTNLTPGSYALKITDDNGCELVQSYTITEPKKLTINGVVTDASCNGSCDGKIDITVKDGTPKTGGGYDFSWYKNGSTSAFSNLEDISSQCAGDYKIVITDSNSCTATTTLAIKEPTALQCSTSVIDVKCYGDNTGSIKSYPSGGTKGLNGDYKSYSWTGPSGFTDPGTSDASKLKAGDYTLTIIDANGCKITKKQTIQEPRKAITLQYTVTQIKCNGEKTGEISNTLSGGTVANGKDYSYSWTGPTGFVNPGTCNLTNLTPGSYALKITDDNGCELVQSYTITEPKKLTINGVVTDASCNGSCDGKIDITVKDGTPKTGGGYDFSWYKNGSTSAFSNLEDISSQCAGDYKIVITDANLCTATTTLAIKEPTALQCSISVIDVKCYGDSTGSMKSYPSGGTKGLNGDYASYSWTGPSGFTDPGTSDASKLKAGDYTLTIIDANGCKFTKKQTIQEQLRMNVSHVITDVNCFGDNTGEISIDVSGGKPPYLSYKWFEATDPTNIISKNKDLNNLVAKNYFVVVEDSYNCLYRKDFTVKQNTEILIITKTKDVSCHGGNDGEIDIDVIGGKVGPIGYSYNWTKNSSNYSTNEDLLSLSIGNYAVTVKDDLGCLKMESVDILQPKQLDIKINLDKVIECNGNANGQISAVVSGGTRPYDFSWNNFNSVKDSFLQNIPAGNFWVNVIDSKGCSIGTQYKLNEPDALSAKVLVDSANCFGKNDGSIVINLTGGIKPYKYKWGANVVQSSDSIATELYSGYYTVEMEDFYKCKLVETIKVSEPNLLEVDLKLIKPVRCYGESNGQGIALCKGGTKPYKYYWDGSKKLSDSIINDFNAGNHSVFIEDFYGCSVTDAFNVTGPNPIQSRSISDSVTCKGLSNGTATIFQINGGNPFKSTIPNSLKYEIYWVGSDTLNWWKSSDIPRNKALIDPNSKKPYYNKITEKKAQRLFYVIIDTLGCSNLFYSEILEPWPLDAKISVKDLDCYEVNTGSAKLEEIISSGNGAPYKYRWNQNNLLFNNSVNGLGAGVIQFELWDFKGCYFTTKDTILQPLPSKIRINDTFGCHLTTVNVTAYFDSMANRTPVEFSWMGYSDVNCKVTLNNKSKWTSNNASLELNNIEETDEGYYQITIKDAKGCYVTGKSFIEHKELPVISAEISQWRKKIGADTLLVCKGDDAIFTGSLNGGKLGRFNWAGPNQWSTNFLDDKIEGAVKNHEGKYILHGIDNFGCSDSDFVILKIRPDISISSDLEICSGSSLLLIDSGSVDRIWTGPNGIISKLKNPIFPNVDTLYTGKYLLIGSDELNCIDTKSLNVIVYPWPYVKASVNDTICESGYLKLAASSMNGQNYLWYFNNSPNYFSQKQNLTIKPVTSQNQGNYKVISITEKGCRDSASLFALVRPKPKVDFVWNHDGCMASTHIPITFSSITTGANSYWFSIDDILKSKFRIFEDSFLNAGDYKVVLRAESEFGCVDSQTKIVKIIDLPRVWLPTAFTPNKNVLNDRYKPVCWNVSKYTMKIYDRWGGKQYEITVDGQDVYNPLLGSWDGKINGIDAPIGVYVAIVESEDLVCNIKVSKSSFTLLR